MHADLRVELWWIATSEHGCEADLATDDFEQHHRIVGLLAVAYESDEVPLFDNLPCDATQIVPRTDQRQRARDILAGGIDFATFTPARRVGALRGRRPNPAPRACTE